MQNTGGKYMKKIFLCIALAHAALVINSAMATNEGVCGISEIKAGTCTGAATGYGIEAGTGAGNVCAGGNSECTACSQDSTQNCNKNTYNITFEQNNCKSYTTTCYNGIPIRSCSECSSGYILLEKQIPWCTNYISYQVCRKQITSSSECWVGDVAHNDWKASAIGDNLIQSYFQYIGSCNSSDSSCVNPTSGQYCDRVYVYGCADGYYNGADDYYAAEYSRDYKLIRCSACPTVPESWMQQYLHSAWYGSGISPVYKINSCYIGNGDGALYTDNTGTFEWDGCYYEE